MRKTYYIRNGELNILYSFCLNDSRGKLLIYVRSNDKQSILFLSTILIHAVKYVFPAFITSFETKIYNFYRTREQTCCDGVKATGIQSHYFRKCVKEIIVSYSIRVKSAYCEHHRDHLKVRYSMYRVDTWFAAE
jgi:hypothetical protein